MNIREKIIYFLEYQQEIIKMNIHKESIRALYQYYSDTNSEIGVSRKAETEDIAVSLTSYGDRINTVHLTIESIMMQTMKPRDIILWLSQDEFEEHRLPLQLLQKKERGLRIEFCDDLKSYKKLVPYLKSEHANNIITVDDDIIYPRDLIENLWNEHLSYPDDVIFNRGHVMQLLPSKKGFAPYQQWLSNCDMSNASLLNLPTGVGGILYPEGSLNSLVVDVDTFVHLAPNADDLWFKAMTLLNHKSCRQTSYGKNIIRENDFLWKFVPIEDEQKDKLGATNVILNRNDEQWHALAEHFKLLDIILEKTQ